MNPNQFQKKSRLPGLHSEYVSMQVLQAKTFLHSAREIKLVFAVIRLSTEYTLLSQLTIVSFYDKKSYL